MKLRISSADRRGFSAGAADRRRGQSLVEFAVFVPVLLLILLMAVDFGRVYLGWVNLNNVVRIGANYAAQNPTGWQGGGDTDVQSRYRELMAKDARGVNCTLPGTLPAPTFVENTDSYDVGSRVKVEITCSFPLLTPLLSSLIGDGSGNVAVTSSSTFTIRNGSIGDATVGGNVSTPMPTDTPVPTAEPTPEPTAAPTETPDPGVTPDPGATPTAAPTATPVPVVVSFYGTPTSTDSSGGGPPGSVDENLIVGIRSLTVTFSNTTTGAQGNCQWLFGDGGSSNACSGTVSYSYNTRGTYTVSLTVDDQTVSRSSYVLVGCKVPSFSGVRENDAEAMWVEAGFDSDNIDKMDGNGNHKIGFQSLAGGMVNPPGGCSGASIIVGP